MLELPAARNESALLRRLWRRGSGLGHSRRCRRAGLLESVDRRAGFRLSAAHAPGSSGREQDLVESQTGDCPCISYRGGFVLQSVSGVGIDAARVARDTPVHQLSLCFERERFRVTRQDPPWKVVRAFAHLTPVIGPLEQCLGRRAGGRSPGAGCRSPGRRGSANHHHRRHSLVSSSRRRGGFRTARDDSRSATQHCSSIFRMP